MYHKLSSKASAKAKQQGKKGSYKQKGILQPPQLCPSEKKQENRKLWKVKCENIWEQAKKKSEKQLPRNMKRKYLFILKKALSNTLIAR